MSRGSRERQALRAHPATGRPVEVAVPRNSNVAFRPAMAAPRRDKRGTSVADAPRGIKCPAVAFSSKAIS